MTETIESDDQGVESEHEGQSTISVEELQKQFLAEIRPHISVITEKLELQQTVVDNVSDVQDSTLSAEKEEATDTNTEQLLLDACCDGKKQRTIEVLQEMDLHVAIETLQQLLAALESGATKKAEEEEAQEKEEQTEPAEPPKKRLNYREILESTKGTFADTMHPSPALLKHLEDKSVLNYEMVSQVLCRPSRPDRVKCLIELLMDLGPKSLIVFIEGLKITNQIFLANILASQVSQNFGS